MDSIEDIARREEAEQRERDQAQNRRRTVLLGAGLSVASLAVCGYAAWVVLPSMLREPGSWLLAALVAVPLVLVRSVLRRGIRSLW